MLEKMKLKFQLVILVIFFLESKVGWFLVLLFSNSNKMIRIDKLKLKNYWWIVIHHGLPFDIEQGDASINDLLKRVEKLEHFAQNFELDFAKRSVFDWFFFPWQYSFQNYT